MLNHRQPCPNSIEFLDYGTIYIICSLTVSLDLGDLGNYQFLYMLMLDLNYAPFFFLKSPNLALKNQCPNQGPAHILIW